MNPFQKALHAALARRDATHTRRILRPLSHDGHLAHEKTSTYLDLASNDYLNLAYHPALRQRAAEWAECYGAGARASRLVSGTLPQHQHIEKKLANFKKSEAALLFATGWQANASLIPALCVLSLQETGHKAQFFMDRLNHASLHHGCASAGVHQKRFQHNDLNHLEMLLHRNANTPGLKFIITESVFSMDGDCADLPALRQLADRFNAFLYVDEAHATGILGPEGRGLSQGLADITISTASKALGGMGAFITGSQALCDYMLNHASGFIYSTALPPAILGALDAALDLIPSLENERQKVQHYAHILRQTLTQAGYDTSVSHTQIIPVMIGQSQTALHLAQVLEQEGFLTVAIRPPTVPPHTARLRLALNSGLTEDDIHHLSKALLHHLPLCTTPSSTRPT